ncbi:hypothetical protein [Amnibacterium endophyticum]|uniref:Asp23/Gls24 family envelope stress response protein n=1 Tax=Amnibacterium endophyticum TaxID=2109337 RepID=A0ABW4LFU3_9MICO
MSTAVAAAPPAAGASTRGRTRITGPALQRVVAAVAGEALGVDAKDVGTDLTDHGGALDLAVDTPIGVPSISRVREQSKALERSGGSILERCAAAEQTVRDRVHELTGYDIRRVTVRVTGVRITKERRVR